LDTSAKPFLHIVIMSLHLFYTITVGRYYLLAARHSSLYKFA